MLGSSGLVRDHCVPLLVLGHVCECLCVFVCSESGGLEMWKDPIVRKKINPYNEGENGGDFLFLKGRKGQSLRQRRKARNRDPPRVKCPQKA